MVGKHSYTKNAYQLFLDDFRNNLNKSERSNAKKVIKEGALAWSNLKNDAVNNKNQLSIDKLDRYKEEARKLKLTKNDIYNNNDYDYYLVDFDDDDDLSDQELDERLEKQQLYMIAHPGADSTPYD